MSAAGAEGRAVPVPVPVLDRAGADAALDAADAAVRDASASLVALEAHPGYVVLRTWPLTGVSARRWEQTAATVAELHTDFDLYRDVVARARAARGTGRRPSSAELAEVAELLEGPSVLLATHEIPLQRRGLLGPAAVTERIRPPELLARMAAAFDAATGVVAGASAVRDAVAARLDPLDRDLDDLDRAVAALGIAPADAGTRTPAAWRAEVTELRRAVLADPLAADPARPLDERRVQAVRSGLAALRTRLDALATLRADLGARVAALDAGLDALAVAEDAATAAAADVARTIATGDARLPRPLRRSGDLRADRRAAEAAAVAGRWSAAAAAFDRVDEAVAAARRRTDADQDILGGLLARRAELRGRLTALAAKAARTGRAEDLDLDALRRDAQDLLWTAPCDLAASTVAVRRYQRALEGRGPT